MALDAGTRLGPYEVVALIGAGGMGEVYKASDTRLNRTVAIKVLPPYWADSPDMKARFDREAQTIASLTHPHICTLHDIGREATVGERVTRSSSPPAARGFCACRQQVEMPPSSRNRIPARIIVSRSCCPVVERSSISNRACRRCSSQTSTR